MERQVRARFLVFRINRWSLALLLLAALALVLIPRGGLVPAIGPTDIGQVRQGVTLLGRDFSGKSEPEVRQLLAAMADRLQSAPIAAHEARAADGNAYVIPELNGYQLDLEMTWQRLSQAPEGGQVEPAARIHTPTKRLSDFPQSVIRQGNVSKQAVGLLINVDWGDKELEQMLPILRRRGAKATFFVSGRWANDHTALLQHIAADGHEIASHGHDLRYGPRDLARSGKLKGDIAQSVQVIEAATSEKVRYWAPHMSEVDNTIVRTASELGLRTVLYSVDTIDWMESSTPPVILQRLSKAMAGDLILMHPKPNTVKVLDEAVRAMQGRGLRPVTLTEMLSPAPDLPQGAWDQQHD